jgi:uncharacterized protein
VNDLLTEHQRAILRRVIDEESQKREHLCVYLSGAHAYGFPSPDSDLDLKCVHIAPARDLLGLESVPPTFDRAEVIEGVEIDYTANEVAHVLRGILAGNGNFLERILGATVVYASPSLATLRPLARASISRRFHRHYRGFARQQLSALEKEPTVKHLLYVLRTALTGAHLLETGELIIDLRPLIARFEMPEVAALIERKRAGERVHADAETIARFRTFADRALRALDDAHATSSLPEIAPNEDELETWLVELRLTSLRE